MKNYTTQEFYRYLKLGIWISGRVNVWGLVEQITVYPDCMTNKGYFVSKIPKFYTNELQDYKQQLSIGLQMLDLYPLEEQQIGKSKTYTHLAVVRECRLRNTYQDCIYYLKITNNDTFTTFKKKLNDPVMMKILDSGRKRKSVFGKARQTSRFDFIPINSTPRKY